MYVSYTMLSSGTVNDGLPGNRNWTVSVCLKCLIGVPLESTMPHPYTIILIVNLGFASVDHEFLGITIIGL
jgi:hypothetical protein